MSPYPAQPMHVPAFDPSHAAGIGNHDTGAWPRDPRTPEQKIREFVEQAIAEGAIVPPAGRTDLTDKELVRLQIALMADTKRRTSMHPEDRRERNARKRERRAQRDARRRGRK